MNDLLPLKIKSTGVETFFLKKWNFPYFYGLSNKEIMKNYWRWCQRVIHVLTESLWLPMMRGSMHFHELLRNSRAQSQDRSVLSMQREKRGTKREIFSIPRTDSVPINRFRAAAAWNGAKLRNGNSRLTGRCPKKTRSTGSPSVL